MKIDFTVNEKIINELSDSKWLEGVGILGRIKSHPAKMEPRGSNPLRPTLYLY